uniref:Uncharacterized protein n=1 Tax=Manihot esculenta TaxID=3983 RepID=A0A2C9U9Q0_MANES
MRSFHSFKGRRVLQLVLFSGNDIMSLLLVCWQTFFRRC